MNKGEILFELENVVCAYSGFEKDAVLKINNLKIPRGQIIFLLGASGSGKSTLLETLGLMNSTLVGGNIYFRPDTVEQNPIEYQSLWRNSSGIEISEIRKRYFSFVFQNTNLMENFSAYENVAISDLIGTKRTSEETLQETSSLMEKVRLPYAVVNYTTGVTNLSGGQRQRLSFVRALAKNPSVLFCDEPTGNLDEANAHEIFEIIKRLKKNNSTAVIVSHDVNLALKYADSIFLITKRYDSQYGEILSENIYHKEIWSNLDDKDLLAFRTRITSLFHLDKEISADTGKQIKQSPGLFRIKSFNSLFFIKEGKSLLGKSFVNLWILILLLSISLTAIGFANGSLKYLERKMNNAFVNWVPVIIPFVKSDEDFIKFISQTLENDSVKKKYDYSSISFFADDFFIIKDYKLEKSAIASECYGRCIDVIKDSSLLTDFILQDKNFVRGNKQGFAGEKDLSLIVKKSFLDNLDYPEDAEYIDVEFSFDDSSSKEIKFFVPVPIRAVVKEIPGKNDLLFTTYFYQVRKQTDVDNVFNIKKYRHNIFFYLRCDNKTANKVLEYVNSSIATDAIWKKYFLASNVQCELSPHKQSYGQGKDLIFRFSEPIGSENDVAQIRRELKRSINDKFTGINIFDIYYYDQVTGKFENVIYDGMSIHFETLKNVRGLNNYINKNLNDKDSRGKIEMDESQVTEKDNFYFLSNVTQAVSYLIIVFGCLALSIFIFNLLRNHLQKVKMNIGTFKAMGLSNSRTLRIYFLIISVFIVSGIILSFIFVSGLGIGINSLLEHYINLDGEVKYFKLTDAKTIISIVIFFFVSLTVSWLTIRQILSKTPGDLIYNRS
jgi:putative ABC transport system ATP-binding protein